MTFSWWIRGSRTSAGKKRDSERCSIREVACGSRSSDFGVMMISGRCLATRA